MNSDVFKNRYANFLDDYKAQSPLQAGRVLGADAQNALMDLGKTILPGFTATIKEADSEIHGWESTIKDLGSDFHAAENAVSGFAGAAASAWASLRHMFGLGDGSGPHTGALGPSVQGRPMHPSGLGPQSGQYPRQGGADSIPPIHVKSVVMLDGRVIGQSTSSQFASNSQFPRQAAVGDSYSGWWAPDGNATA